MCGIAGIFHREGRLSPQDTAAVRRMTAAQRHRGPDDAGYFDDRFIALGHRRLAIVDLSPAGRQPMANEDGTIRLVANGEIYNHRDLRRELIAGGHRFGSESDCEVMVHGYEQWGMDGLLRRLRGMFAMLLYDARRETCFAVRDRLGIKPLYHASCREGRDCFASELKALALGGLVEPHVDESAMAGFLLFGSVPHPLTWQRNVKCIEPGCYLELSRDNERTVRYWRPDEPADAPGSLNSTLALAVRQHLISDAPLGIFLSSGVDSTGLAALARRAGVRARTLTVIFDEAGYNEETTGIAAGYGTEHCEVRITAEDFQRELPRVFAAMDQPASDGLNTYFVSKAAHESGLKTVLSGLGADEIFGGYRHFHWLARYRRELKMFGQMPRALRKAAAAVAAMGSVRNESWGRLGRLGEATPESLYLAMRGFFAPDVVSRLTGRGVKEILERMPPFAQPAAEACEFNDTGRFREIEMQRYLHDQLLRDADVFGMTWSLEIRVPYLDHEVVECALAAPEASHRREGVNKPMLVDAIGDDAVTAAARRPKAGFTLPLEKWIRSHSAELRERALAADLERNEIKRLWRAFEDGRMNAVHAWALVVLGSTGSHGGGARG